MLKLDLRGYFMNIDRRKLYGMLVDTFARFARRPARDGKTWEQLLDYGLIRYLTREIVFNDPTYNCYVRGRRSQWEGLPPSKSLFHTPEGCGLPIGNLTSQLFSNVYLSKLDDFVKRSLGERHYGRYVDDFYIVHNDPGYLLSLIPAIGRFLRDDAALSLHPDKTKLANVLGGIAFLGSYIKPYRRYVLHRTVFRIREKLDRLDRRPPGYFAEPRRLRRALSSANSFLGTFVRARTYRLRQEVFRGSVMFRYCHATPLLRKLVLDRRWKEMRVIDPDRWLENEQFEKNRKNNRRIGTTSGEK